MRVKYIDITRGLAIILVMIGHLMPTVFWDKYVCSFHMPLFFMITGMTFALKNTEEIDIKRFCKKEFSKLYIPYFIWIMIFSKYTWQSWIYAAYGSFRSMIQMESYPNLWFLPCLMIANILFVLLLKISKCINSLGGGIFKRDCFIYHDYNYWNNRIFNQSLGA